MGEWISVKDKLPSKQGYYIVCWDWFGRKEISMVFFRGKTHWAKLEHRITHWMPLPEPPKETE